ncbi:hypothetical protein LPJ66_002780 [Kickxella alabastrina]|uniref:Uncharacterized protein n=1 Tax=Kickxella alabastrina TaxID=61397 RepID=A0ACC1IPP6_9FUNG|nr:hypothetical protein LPJ66_002780 [Kickxella alabastrina]
MTTINIDELSSLKRKQLQSLCKKHAIRANGKSEELIKRIVKYVRGGGGNDGSISTTGDKDTVTETPSADEDSAIEQDNNNNEEEEEEEEQYESADEALKQVDSQSTLASEPQETADKSDEAPEAASEPASEPDLDIVDRMQTPTVAEQVVAELELRSSALTADERKNILDQFTAENNIVSVTPSKARQIAVPRSVSFDRVHSKIFESDDSIVNHWAASKKEKDTVSAAATATPKGKRANADVETPRSNKRSRVESISTLTVRTESPRQKRRGSSKVEPVSSKTAQEDVTGPEDAEDDGSVEAAAVSTEKVVVAPSAPVVDPKKPAESVKTAKIKPTTIKDQTNAKPTVQARKKISKTYIIKHPRSSVAPAERKSKLSTTSALSRPVTAKPAKTSEMAPAVVSTQDRAAVKGSKPRVPNFRSVESKVKAYINSKPPSPKVKAVKYKIVEAKQAPQPQTTKAEPKLKPKPKVSVAAAAEPKTPKVDASGKEVPGYMRSTRATEVRSHKPEAAKDGKSRFSPYSRPATKPTAAKPIASKPEAK